MRFDVPLTEYEACGQCGHTRPLCDDPSQLTVTDRDLARAVTGNTVSQLVGQRTGTEPRRERMLLRSNLLRIRAVVRAVRRGALTGHSMMDTHHGSARKSLSEDFGIAMATSFLTKTHGLRQHYNLDAVANKQMFGIPPGQRPDIGSVARTGWRALTEAKGRLRRRDLEPRPFRVEPAKLVRKCFQQLTGGGSARLAAPTRLFVCVTSPIAAGQDIRLDTAEYVRGPADPCPMCVFERVPEDERLRRPVELLVGTDWDGLDSGWYQSFTNIVGGADADLDETGQYRIHEVAGADVTIGLHRRIVRLVSRPDASLGRRLSNVLDSLPQNLDTADDGRYSDGTLIRTEWPELEADDEDDADDVQ